MGKPDTVTCGGGGGVGGAAGGGVGGSVVVLPEEDTGGGLALTGLADTTGVMHTLFPRNLLPCMCSIRLRHAAGSSFTILSWPDLSFLKTSSHLIVTGRPCESNRV